MSKLTHGIRMKEQFSSFILMSTLRPMTGSFVHTHGNSNGLHSTILFDQLLYSSALVQLSPFVFETDICPKGTQSFANSSPITNSMFFYF